MKQQADNTTMYMKVHMKESMRQESILYQFNPSLMKNS